MVVHLPAAYLETTGYVSCIHPGASCKKANKEAGEAATTLEEYRRIRPIHRPSALRDFPLDQLTYMLAEVAIGLPLTDRMVRDLPQAVLKRWKGPELAKPRKLGVDNCLTCGDPSSWSLSSCRAETSPSVGWGRHNRIAWTLAAKLLGDEELVAWFAEAVTEILGSVQYLRGDRMEVHRAAP